MSFSINEQFPAKYTFLLHFFFKMNSGTVNRTEFYSKKLILVFNNLCAYADYCYRVSVEEHEQINKSV